MEKDEIKVMAEATAAEAQVGIKKAEALRKYLAENKIEGFGIQNFQDDVHSHAFRSNLPVAGTNLAFMILLDDSVYTRSMGNGLCRRTDSTLIRALN